MDRIDFSKSINVDPILQIQKFFDEVMAMYNLIEGVEYKCIHGLVGDWEDSEIRFVVTFNTCEDAVKTAYGIDNKIVQFCNNNFKISSDIENYDSSEMIVQLIKI